MPAAAGLRGGAHPALLSAAAGTARSHGAHGLWLSLQTRHVAALRALGRFDDAQVQALAAWQRVEEGIAGLEMFPRMAAELCAALADSHADLAQVIALRASAWMQQAAATLPPVWRENYPMRAPILQTLPPAARASLLGRLRIAGVLSQARAPEPEGQERARGHPGGRPWRAARG